MAALVCVAPAETERRTLQHHDVVVDKELLITATEVVDSTKADYPGPWSFGHLVEQAYGTDRAASVVARWLAGWAKGASASGGREAQAPRPGLVEKLVRPWQKADGYDPDAGPWVPNLSNAPFRLLAISNRMDLARPLASIDQAPPRSGSAYYSSGSLFADASGGEARFTFALTDQDGKALKPGSTIIFEYGLDVLQKKEHLLEWATAWHGLGAYDEFDEFYLYDLEKLTRAFTDTRERATMEQVANGGPPVQVPVRFRSKQLLRERSALRAGKPMHERLAIGAGLSESQLLRIRTNEGSFDQVREFRQFDRGLAQLVAAPLPGTARETFFRPGSSANKWIVKWIANHEDRPPVATSIRDAVKPDMEHAFAVPATGTMGGLTGPVVAMVSPVVGGNANYHWKGKGVDPRMRHSFSAQSCCGCHCGDTNTEFFHIAPRERGEMSKLSEFLRTDGSHFDIKDPASGEKIPSAEMDLRSKTLELLLNQELDQYQVAEILGEN